MKRLNNPLAILLVPLCSDFSGDFRGLIEGSRRVLSDLLTLRFLLSTIVEMHLLIIKSMFIQIFLYELKYWLRKPAPYIYFAVFFVIGFSSFAGTAGFVDSHTLSGKTQRIINSPFELNYILQYFNKFFLFLLPAIIGATVYKDVKNKVHHILYSFPIHKRDYLFGKFLSAWLVVILVTTGVGLGIFAAEFLPNLHPEKVGPFRAWGYLQGYFVYTIPNMLIHGIFVFSTVVWLRNIYAGFVTVILLFLVQIISENAFGHQGHLISLFDPFAQNTVAYLTHLWTLEEKNSQIIPVLGAVIYNRMFWMGIASAIFGYTYYRFSLTENQMFPFLKKESGKRLIKNNFQIQRKTNLPTIGYDFSLGQQVKNTWKLSMIQFRYIVKNGMFLIIGFLGILAIIFALSKVTETSSMALLPVTRLVLSVPAFFFTSIIMLLTFLYAGMLVHRDRMAGMNQLVDTTAIPSWTLLLSKVLALIKMQVVLLGVMMLAGMILQVYHGYFNFELDVYLFDLFVLKFMILISWTFASIFVHTWLTNVYLSLFILVMGWMGVSSLSQLGIDTYLLHVNSPPQLQYSDLNGYGNDLPGYFLVEAYWWTLGLILLIASYLGWYRGFPSSLKERFNSAKARFTRPLQISAGILLTLFLLLGAKIYQEESSSILSSGKSQNKALADFKEKYGHHEHLVQPRITNLKVELDLFPEENRFEARGNYTLINRSNRSIDTLLIKTGFDEQTTFELNRKNNVVSEDAFMKYSVIHFEPALQPGDSMNLQFSIVNADNTLFERNSIVLDNATFLKQDIFPRIGYFLGMKKTHPNDSSAGKNHYHAIDSDRIGYEAIVSTSKDQTALTTGHLIKKWTENDRRYFHYKMDQSIKYSLGANSGDFEVKTEMWNDVKLSIYHHKGHEYNLNSMMNGMVAALEYNSTHFGPYQHSEANIIEFPQSEGTYATTYGNSIPMSEVRFIANADTASDKMDLSFYVPSHELTHQWWGAQLTPADAFGALMISESVTEYISLNIYREQYGEKHAANFLNAQRQRYLKGRTGEQETEPSLSLVKSSQQYLAYGKGTMAFHALGYHLGTDNLNQVLRSFLEDYKFQNAPYPTSLELIARLRNATPDSLQYLITDWFESVVFYENKLESATVRNSDSNTYELTVSFSIQKNSEKVIEQLIKRPRRFSKPPRSIQAIEQKNTADSLVVNLPFAEYIELEILNDSGKTISITKHKISSINNQISITLDQPPAQVVLDPHLLMMEKDRRDNTIEVK